MLSDVPCSKETDRRPSISQLTRQKRKIEDECLSDAFDTKGVRKDISFQLYSVSQEYEAQLYINVYSTVLFMTLSTEHQNQKVHVHATPQEVYTAVSKRLVMYIILYLTVICILLCRRKYILA